MMAFGQVNNRTEPLERVGTMTELETARRARRHTRIFATTAAGWAEVDRRDQLVGLAPRDRATGLPTRPLRLG